jgi:ferredoxin
VQWQWRLIQAECTGCGICADICPAAAIVMPRELAYPLPAPDLCTGCMLCTAECPFGAIEVTKTAVQEVHQ